MSNKPLKASDINKPWNRRKNSAKPYNITSLAIAKSFLIVCEGKNTEPLYFKSFPVVSADIETRGGLGSRTALVKAAITLMNQKQNLGRETWCVFDFDVKLDNATIPGDYNNAIDLAKRNNINVAYSNDAFELWFVLHYQYLDNQLTRYEYYGLLEQIWELKESYEEIGKTESFCSSLYSILLPRQSDAIRNARKLADLAEGLTYSDQNPITMVYTLVEELNNYIRK